MGSKQQPQAVILCEDVAHSRFARAFLIAKGWNARSIRTEMAEAGKGSAEQWVRERYPLELKAYRSRAAKYSVVLIVMIDADAVSVRDRHGELHAAALPDRPNTDSRSAGEQVAIIVPKRNIEGWFHFLASGIIDEEDKDNRYHDQYNTCDIAKLADKLRELCISINGPKLPDSLAASCDEWRNRIAI